MNCNSLKIEQLCIGCLNNYMLNIFASNYVCVSAMIYNLIKNSIDKKDIIKIILQRAHKDDIFYLKKVIEIHFYEYLPMFERLLMLK